MPFRGETFRGETWVKEGGSTMGHQAEGIHSHVIRAVAIENVNSYGADPSSLGAVKLPFNTFGLKPDRNLITPVTITGRRDPVEPAQGFDNVAGDAVIPVDQCAIGYWLQMLLGYPVSTATGSAYQHVFDVSSHLNSFTVEKGFTDMDVPQYHKFNGVKATGFSMTAGGDEELTATFNLMGARESSSGSSIATPTEIVLNRFNQIQGTLEVNGVASRSYQEFVLNINNNPDDSIYTIGNGSARGALPVGLIEVSGSIKALFENSSLHLQAESGTPVDFNMKFQTGSFYLSFDIDEALFKRSGPMIDTPGGIWIEMEYMSYFKAGGNGTVLRTTLVNTWASYSSQPA